MSTEQARAAGSALFHRCYVNQGTNGTIDDVMLCVTQGLEAQQIAYSMDTRNWLLVLCGSMVLLMQVRYYVHILRSFDKRYDF